MERTGRDLSRVSDCELLRLTGERSDAFVELFDRHFDAIYRYVDRRVGRELAEDLTQDVFLTALACRARVRPVDGTALPWLYGIATNCVRRNRRTERRRLAALARLSEPGMTYTGEEALIERMDAARSAPELAAVLATLSQLNRDLFVLHAVEGLGAVELARALDMPVVAVRVRLHRLRRRIRNRLAESHRSFDDGINLQAKEAPNG